jgi:hypothetical protein
MTLRLNSLRFMGRLTMDKWRSSSFDAQDDEPLGPLANLVDIMLVFACGLIAALVAQSGDLKQHFKVEDSLSVEQSVQQTISQGKELIEVPESLKDSVQGAEGYQSMGQVYKDPKTGKLILISQ